MKIFIDGYSIMGESITKKLIKNHNIDPNNIFVLTYQGSNNINYLNYLKKVGVYYELTKYTMDIIESIQKFDPDLVISLYARRRIPEKVINLANYGTFNLHPSLLPAYKGTFSVPWVILNQENKTGITFHEMTADFDSGNILYQKEVTLSGDETAYELYHKLVSMFVKHFDDFFRKYIQNKITATLMPSGGNYYPRKLPYHGIINPEWDIRKIDAFIRAMHFPPYQGALLEINGEFYECSTIDDYKKYLKNIKK